MTYLNYSWCKQYVSCSELYYTGYSYDTASNNGWFKITNCNLPYVKQRRDSYFYFLDFKYWRIFKIMTANEGIGMDLGLTNLLFYFKSYNPFLWELSVLLLGTIPLILRVFKDSILVKLGWFRKWTILESLKGLSTVLDKF